jgi:hypothetical protein
MRASESMLSRPASTCGLHGRVRSNSPVFDGGTFAGAWRGNARREQMLFYRKQRLLHSKQKLLCREQGLIHSRQRRFYHKQQLFYHEHTLLH